MQAAEKFTGDTARCRALDGLSVPELRAELVEARRVRAMVDARVTDIVTRVEGVARACGTHERCASETQMIGDSSNPDR